mgnify:CR=1 FL=1
MKRKYEKLSMKVVKIQQHQILCGSPLDGDNPFNWGNPDDDR